MSNEVFTIQVDGPLAKNVDTIRITGHLKKDFKHLTNIKNITVDRAEDVFDDGLNT
jgi:hypothetical protein